MLKLTCCAVNNNETSQGWMKGYRFHTDIWTYLMFVFFFFFFYCRFDYPGTLPSHRYEAPERHLQGGVLQPADGPQRLDEAFWSWRSRLQVYTNILLLLLQSSRSSCIGSQAPCTTMNYLLSWRFGSLPQTHVSWANYALLLTGQPPFPSRPLNTCSSLSSSDHLTTLPPELSENTSSWGSC